MFHWLVTMLMGIGVIAMMLMSPIRTGDMSGNAELHPEIETSDVLVADRAFYFFPHL